MLLEELEPPESIEALTPWSTDDLGPFPRSDAHWQIEVGSLACPISGLTKPVNLSQVSCPRGTRSPLQQSPPKMSFVCCLHFRSAVAGATDRQSDMLGPSTTHLDLRDSSCFSVYMSLSVVDNQPSLRQIRGTVFSEHRRSS